MIYNTYVLENISGVIFGLYITIALFFFSKLKLVLDFKPSEMICSVKERKL